MKRVKILLLFVLFAIVSATVVNGQSTRNHKYRSNRNHNRPVVGAPLDGGLLTVLGVAGVAYYTTRRNNKKNRGL